MAIPNPSPTESLPRTRRVSRLRAGLPRLVSFVIAIVALIWVATRIEPAQTWARLRSADPAWFLLGFGAFYLSLPLRAWRWRTLLRNLGDDVPLRILMSAIFRAWTVNCALPGRGGDVYSAYALRTERGMSFAFVMGTIFSARVLDLLTLVVLVAVIFHWKFQEQLPSIFGTLVYFALGLGAVVIVGFLLLGRLVPMSRRILPRRFADAYGTFARTTFGSVKRLPLLLLLTVLLWVLEAFRLWCVLGAIDAPRPIAQVTFLALAAAVLTTLPITPGGLGTVEALYQEFLPYTGITTSAAASAAILDRIINYWFILLVGGVHLLLTRRRSGTT